MTKKVTTKNRIIFSSKRIFKRYGYKQVTINQIAEDAGITLSLFSYYYPKKQDLLIKIMGDFINTIYYFALLYSNKDPVAAFLATNYIYTDKLLNNPDNLKFYIDIMNIKSKNCPVSCINFNKMYINMIKHLNVDISYDMLCDKSTYIYGANKALVKSYLNDSNDTGFSEIVDEIATITCNLLGISDYIIDECRSMYLDTVEKLNKINFQLL